MVILVALGGYGSTRRGDEVKSSTLLSSPAAGMETKDSAVLAALSASAGL